MIIYKTTNLLNGKIYVGKSIHSRRHYLGSGIYIARAINKYGKQNFKKEILQECNCKTALDIFERIWIVRLDSRNPKIGYNIALGSSLDISDHEEVEHMLYERRFTRYNVVVFGKRFSNAKTAAIKLKIDFEEFKEKLLDKSNSDVVFFNENCNMTFEEKQQKKIDVSKRKEQHLENIQIYQECKLQEEQTRQYLKDQAHDEWMLEKAKKIKAEVDKIIDNYQRYVEFQKNKIHKKNLKFMTDLYKQQKAC